MNEVWVTQIGCLATACYAEGTDVTVTVHQTREGAAAMIRSRFAEQGLPEPDTANAGGEFVEGDDVNDQYLWSWSIVTRPLQD